MTLGHEQLQAMDDMRYSESWASGFWCYEQLNVVDDMNDLGSQELKPLDAKNISRLWMIWSVLCRELRNVDDMNDSMSWA